MASRPIRARPRFEYARGNSQTSGESNMDRLTIGSSSLTAATGVLRLSYWTAKKTGAYTKMRMDGGSTAAAATPTLVRFGVYVVDAVGDLSGLIAIANDTALFSVASTEEERAFTATFNAVRGRRYASAFLIVTAGATPTLCGTSSVGAPFATVRGRTPRLMGSLAAQTNLPATITEASLTTAASGLYAEVAP